MSFQKEMYPMMKAKVRDPAACHGVATRSKRWWRGRSVYERRQRSMHTAVCRHVPSRFYVKQGGFVGVRERSEFPQYQTYQRYVRVVVLGVLGLTCRLGLKAGCRRSAWRRDLSVPG